MCVYSASVPDSRDGEVGDKLVLRRLRAHGHTAKGFVEQDDRNCVVCLSDGMCLAVSKIPWHFRILHGVGGTERAIFVGRPGKAQETDNLLLIASGMVIPFFRLPTGIHAKIVPLEMKTSSCVPNTSSRRVKQARRVLLATGSAIAAIIALV